MSIIEPMVIDMDEAQVRTLEQVRQDLEGTQSLEFRRADDDEGGHGARINAKDPWVTCHHNAELGGSFEGQPTRLILGVLTSNFLVELLL